MSVSADPTTALEAERALLGALLRDSEMGSEVSAMLKPEDFSHPKNRIVADTIWEMLDRSEPIDIATVREAVKKHPKGRGRISAVFISDLSEDAGSPS